MEWLMETHAREKANMQPEWRAYKWKCYPQDASETIYYEITGITAPLKTKGVNKGRPNWDKGDKTTLRIVNILVDEHDNWVNEWEKRTGKCSECTGSGKTIKSSGIEGTTYRTCKRCNGTGKSI